MFSHIYRSPIGDIVIHSDGESVTSLRFLDVTESSDGSIDRNLPIFDAAASWLDRYFSGTDPGPTPPIRTDSTPFRETVWHILKDIPYGQTVSYGRVAVIAAEMMGKDRMSAQAIGNAVGSNPVAIMIPCHRVIGSDGSLTGYAGGIDRKAFLLSLEMKSTVGTSPKGRRTHTQAGAPATKY